jgi:hypothetical protein
VRFWARLTLGFGVGCRPEWVQPRVLPGWDIAVDVTPAALEAAFASAADAGTPAKAALIVSPTYFGTTSDIPGTALLPPYSRGVKQHSLVCTSTSQVLCLWDVALPRQSGRMVFLQDWQLCAIAMARCCLWMRHMALTAASVTPSCRYARHKLAAIHLAYCQKASYDEAGLPHHTIMIPFLLHRQPWPAAATASMQTS